MKGVLLPAAGGGNRLGSIEAGLKSVNRRPLLWLTLFAVLLAAQIRPWWFPQADGRSFLSMAKSLAVDGQMRNLGRAHLWYFPGYSLLLSPLYLVSERPFWLVSAFQWTSAILFMVGVYCWARSVVPQWAVWIAALCVLNEGVWIHCARTMSEVPFMCGLIWSTNAARRAAQSASWRRAAGLGAVAAMLLAITSLVRPAGILLAVGFGLHLGWKAIVRETSWARAIALSLLVGLPGCLAVGGFVNFERANAARDHARTYLNNFSDSAANPLSAYVEGARLAIRDSGRVMIPGMFKAYEEKGWRDLNLLVYFPACLVVAFGWARLVAETRDPLLLMTPFYVLLYVVYPYEAGARFYIPLLPVFAASMTRLVLFLPAGRHVIVAAALGAHLTLAVGYWLMSDADRGRLAMARWQEIDPIAAAIGERHDHVIAWNASGDDVFMLELAIDRPIPFVSPAATPSTAEWILAKRSTVGSPQFECAVETASLCLLRRRDHERAPLAQ